MLDATAKPKAGILSGDINQIGNYDQCLAIRKELDRSVIEGKHCTAIASRGVRSTAMSISEVRVSDWIHSDSLKPHRLLNSSSTTEI